jgi:hypothetical protein
MYEFIGVPANDKEAVRRAEWMHSVTGYRPIMAGYSLHGGQRIPLFMPTPPQAKAMKEPTELLLGGAHGGGMSCRSHEETREEG